MGIPAWRSAKAETNTGTRKRNPKFRWTPDLDALLGTMPDASLATMIGVKPMTVTHRRKANGIPAFGYGKTKP